MLHENIRLTIISLFVVAVLHQPLAAQQNPYFVTYDHHMEEPRNLEISIQGTVGLPGQNLPGYLGQLLELEYGATGWWSSSLYLEGTSQRGDATVFTGFRLENRFKPLKTEHRINPVLYFEYENVNEASRIQKEIVGHAELATEPVAVLRTQTAREIESKLILSTSVKNWNISENFIVEKNLVEPEGFEFGYAVAISRPLSTLASGAECRFCRENFAAGLEFYGGLGDSGQFGFQDTAHYIAPALVWNLSRNHALKISPAFGLTGSSNRLLLRFGYTYEIGGFGQKVSRMLRGL